MPVWHGLNPGGLAMVDPPNKRTDNSGTQFALIALWVSGRNGVPTERALALTAKRFRDSQNADGGFGLFFPLVKLRKPKKAYAQHTAVMISNDVAAVRDPATGLLQTLSEFAYLP